MNNLNSVLVEGIVKEKPIMETLKGDIPVCVFCIKTEYKEEINTFQIRARYEQAEICYKHLAKGRGVRVIGRLRQVSSQIYVIADHVEFKSNFRDYSKKFES